METEGGDSPGTCRCSGAPSVEIERQGSGVQPKAARMMIMQALWYRGELSKSVIGLDLV